MKRKEMHPTWKIQFNVLAFRFIPLQILYSRIMKKAIFAYFLTREITSKILVNFYNVLNSNLILEIAIDDISNFHLY